AQPAFLAALAAAARERQLATAVETCLAVPWENIAPAVAAVDLFLCDLKHVDPEKLAEGTGAHFPTVHGNLTALIRAGRPVVARVPVIPGFNDTDEETAAIARFAVGAGIQELHLLPYHALGTPKYGKLARPYPMAGAAALDPERLPALRAAAECPGLTVRVSG
ncbi:MAG: radical SAM protein, partial [Planctomycetes bacterium]|nr:radical SAM protein [Planctomycetota bacterium]